MKFDSQKFYPQTLIFYFACLSGMVLFAAVTYWLNLQNGALSEPPYDIWIGLAACFGLMGVVSSDFVFAWLRNRLFPEGSWEYRSKHLRIALIIRYILLQISATVAGVAFIISGNLYTFLIMVLIIGFTLYRKPTRDQLITQLYASEEEEEWV